MSDPRALLVQAIRALGDAGIEGAPRDARRLLAHVLDMPADRLSIDMPAALTPGQMAAFDRAIARRIDRDPLSHITGQRLFYGRSFRVTPDVLDPRPETEELVAAALSVPFQTVLDLGTGSGCILLSLLAERPGARGQGADLSPRALEVARANAHALGLAERATFAIADWYQGLSGPHDLIVSNPPYIAEEDMAALSAEVLKEPRMALTPGGDGLGPYGILAAGAAQHLAPGGWLMVEIGWQQGPAVVEIFRRHGLEDVSIRHDLDGRDRVVRGRKARIGAKTGQSG